MLSELQNQINTSTHPDARWYVENVMSKHTDKLTLVQAEHVLDYFESIPNKRVKKMSIEDALRLSTEWTKRLQKKGQNIVETEEDVELFMQFKNGPRFVKLLSKAAYQREGNLMSHCVASYHGKTVDIYSLRDSNNTPHCTIEVNSKNINQVKGKGNGSIHPKYIKYVLAFFKKIGKSVREAELEHLGYIPLSTETWTLLDTKVRGVKEMTFKGKRFFFTHSVLKDK